MMVVLPRVNSSKPKRTRHRHTLVLAIVRSNTCRTKEHKKKQWAQLHMSTAARLRGEGPHTCQKLGIRHSNQQSYGPPKHAD